jgi:drug/metabolite transporter (DMT)-like permease
MGSTTTQAPGRLAFPAMITGSACLAFGPWLVRLADVGPLASAFWRQALAVPFLLALAFVVRAPGGKPAGFAGTTLGIVGLTALAGFAFAADLSVWHLGIMRTTLANSTLLANAATFMLPLYGLLVLGQKLSRPQWWALASAAAGVTLLLGRSAELSPRHLAGDLLCLAAAVFYSIYLIAIEKVRGLSLIHI